MHRRLLRQVCVPLQLRQAPSIDGRIRVDLGHPVNVVDPMLKQYLELIDAAAAPLLPRRCNHKVVRLAAVDSAGQGVPAVRDVLAQDVVQHGRVAVPERSIDHPFLDPDVVLGGGLQQLDAGFGRGAERSLGLHVPVRIMALRSSHPLSIWPWKSL